MNPRWFNPVVLFLACLVWLPCAAAQAQCINLGSFDDFANLTDKVETLEDAVAIEPRVALLNQPEWQISSPEKMSRGATKSVIWLRLKVCNTGSKPLSRWLVLGSPRLEFVDFYQFSSRDFELQKSGLSGVGRSFDIRPVPNVLSIFPVSLRHGEESILLLRVKGRTLLNMNLGLWEPLAFREQEAAKTLRQSILMSILLAIALLMLVHGLVHLDRVQLLLSGWMGLVLFFELAFEGYLYQHVFPAGGEIPLRAPLVAINLMSIFCLVFTLNFLDLRSMKYWSRLFTSVLIACFCMSCVSAFGSLEHAITLTIVLSLVVYAMLPLCALAAWLQRKPNVIIYFFAILGLCLTVLLRLFEQIGLAFVEWLPRETMTALASFVFVSAVLLGTVRKAITSRQTMRLSQAKLFHLYEGEQARLEEAVRNRTQALEEAVLSANEDERVNNDLLSRVNRDLSHPVDEIITRAELVISGGGKEAEYAGIIKRSALHLASLIDDLADCAPGGVVSQDVCLQAIEPHAFLDEIAVDAAAIAQRNRNSFTYSRVGILPQRVEIDVKRLRQVLDNLLNNAAKFTCGGHIDLQVELCSNTSESANLWPELVFEVRDTGPGIPPQDLPRIFDPFHRSQLTENFQGLGLGLAIVRHWVDRMGGRIQVVSKMGLGTTMRVFIPVKTDSPNERSAAALKIMALPIVADGCALPAGAACPTVVILEEAELLTKLGAVSDLADWAQSLIEKNSDYEVFAHLVIEHADRGDIRRISTLLERCRLSNKLVIDSLN
jgi:signal transduction histidine kinase